MAIPLTAEKPLEFRPRALMEHETKKNVVIHVRVPTPYERDMYAGNLMRSGVKHHSREKFRALLMTGAVKTLEGQERDEARALLEQSFQVEDAEIEMRALQEQRLIEMHDVDEGDELPGEDEVIAELEKIKPAVTMPDNDRARAVQVINELEESYGPIIEAKADMAHRDAVISWYNVEHFVANWDGLEHCLDQTAESGTPLQRHESEYLRAQIGDKAFEELSDFITAMMGITEDQEKNLSLLLASMSAPTGSTSTTTPSPESSNGQSTTGKKAPRGANGRSKRAPKSTSKKTTAKSSGSGKGSKKTTG